MASLRNSNSSFSSSCFFISLFKSLSALCLSPFLLYILSSSLSLLSLFFSWLFFYLICPPTLSLLFFTHAHIQIIFNFELYYWTSNQKGLISQNRTWATKMNKLPTPSSLHKILQQGLDLPFAKNWIQASRDSKGKSSGLKSDIFCISS